MSKKEKASPIPASQKPRENLRVVHFKVPQSVFNRAKAQAYLSQMPWKEYLQVLLEQASVLPPNCGPTNQRK